MQIWIYGMVLPKVYSCIWYGRVFRTLGLLHMWCIVQSTIRGSLLSILCNTTCTCHIVSYSSTIARYWPLLRKIILYGPSYEFLLVRRPLYRTAGWPAVLLSKQTFEHSHGADDAQAATRCWFCDISAPTRPSAKYIEPRNPSFFARLFTNNMPSSITTTTCWTCKRNGHKLMVRSRHDSSLDMVYTLSSGNFDQVKWQE